MDELNLADTEKYLLPLCREYGIHRAVLTGGEPFQRRDFVDLARLFSDWGFDEFYLGSTLLGIREPAIRQVLEIPAAWNFQVSVDSLNTDTLKKIRGSDLWPRQKANLDWLAPLLAQHQLGIMFACVLSPDNIAEVPELLKHLRDAYPGSMVFIQPAHAFDPPLPPKAVPTKQGYPREFIAEVERLSRHIAELKTDPAWATFLAPLSAQYLAMFGPFFNAEESYIKPCGSSRYLFVNSTGTIRGCLWSGKIADIRDQRSEVRDARRAFQGWTAGCGVCIHGCS